MPKLILCADWVHGEPRKWLLKIRYFESIGPAAEYHTLCRVDGDTARDIVRAGPVEWRDGDPDKNWNAYEDLAKRKLARSEETRG